MRRPAALLVLSLALLVGGTATPAAATDLAAPGSTAIGHRAGGAAQADLKGLARAVLPRGVPRTVAGVAPLPPRAPGLGLLTDIRARPVAPTTFRRTATVWSPPAIRTSTNRAVAAARVRWGHPSDTRALFWSAQTATGIERHVDAALLVLLPRDTPPWLRIALRQASFTAVKTTFCSGLEAVVLRPQGEVRVDLQQVLQEVLRTTSVADLRRTMAYGSNMAAWVQSMSGTVANVSRSALLADDQGRRWPFDPTAYQGVSSFGPHALALATTNPAVFDVAGRHLSRAAFVLYRTCYAPPGR